MISVFNKILNTIECVCNAVRHCLAIMQTLRSHKSSDTNGQDWICFDVEKEYGTEEYMRLFAHIVRKSIQRSVRKEEWYIHVMRRL